MRPRRLEHEDGNQHRLTWLRGINVLAGGRGGVANNPGGGHTSWISDLCITGNLKAAATEVRALRLGMHLHPDLWELVVLMRDAKTVSLDGTCLNSEFPSMHCKV